MKLDLEIEIDYTTYAKNRWVDPLCGYEIQAGRINKGITFHTTNGPKGQTWNGVVTYLASACRASVHYLVPNFLEANGKMKIIRFLDPGKYRAWHCGFVKPAYAHMQDIAIGIECFWDEGMPIDGLEVELQKSGLYTLSRQLINDHVNITQENCLAHRWIVDPKKETRVDPNIFCDSDLHAFIASLFVGIVRK